MLKKLLIYELKIIDALETFAFFFFALYFVFKFRSTYKVPNPMGCTPDKDIRSHYIIPLCLVLSVLYVYATSTCTS